LITGNYDKEDDTLDLHAASNAVVTVMNPNNYNIDNSDNYCSILPVASVTTNFPAQKSIADEFTLNREQRAALMIIASHLNDDNRCRTGMLQNNSLKFKI
jgi:DNA topoisomerase VI subunit B